MRPHRSPVWLLTLTLLSCEDPPDPKAAAASKPLPSVAPSVTAEPKAKTAPNFIINEEGPRIGWSRIMLDKVDGEGLLKKELEAVREFIAEKQVTVVVDRHAKMPWVRTTLRVMREIGATDFLVRTETRDTLPKELVFTASTDAKGAPGCSPVSKLMEDRTTSTWTFGGGAARKHKKGLAGPDLSMTAGAIERLAKACPSADTVFIAGDDAVEWGLVYDMAGITTTLEESKLPKRALLLVDSKAGKKLEL